MYVYMHAFLFSKKENISRLYVLYSHRFVLDMFKTST